MQNKISMNMIKEEIEFINNNLSYFSNIMRYVIGIIIIQKNRI